MVLRRLTLIAPADKGWPRPKLPWEPVSGYRDAGVRLPDRLPVPWINGPCVEQHGDWHSFREGAEAAHYDRLCAVCGEPLGQRIVLGSMGGQQETAGPGGHPRCIWLAANTCPHLARRTDEDDIVAYDYVGPGVGYEATDEHIADQYGAGEDIVPGAIALTRAELKALARRDPMGLGDQLA